MFDNNFTSDNSMFVTCGDWDLKTMLPKHCDYLNISYPNYFSAWANIKVLFSNAYGRNAGGMKNMLDALEIPLDGTHHRGIDDCYNIAKIAQRMIVDKKCKFMPTYRIK